MDSASIVDARRLVADLSEEARRVGDPLPPIDVPPVWTREHVRHRAELAYLNQRWVFETVPTPSSRPGIGNKLRAGLRRLVHRLVLSTLQRYLLDERDFVSNLVRFQNDLAERSDLLLEEIRILGDRVREHDGRIREELARLFERDDLLHRSLERRVEALERTRGR